MARYVDGFLLPMPKKNVPAYRRLARKAGKVWREHGALEYRECVGDDLKVKGLVSFPRRMKSKPGETVVFAWIVYKSRAHRDRVNANDEGPAPREDDGGRVVALRRQAHVLRRVQGPGRRVAPHSPARSRRSARSRAFRVSDAARSNSARASSDRPSFSSRSPRTLGKRW